MNFFVTPKQMQELEALTDRAGVSYAEMMEHAGRGLADCIMEEAPDARTVVFLAGTGNNGGDCYVAAYHLARAGWEVQVFAPLGAPKTEISIAAKARAEALGTIRFPECWDQQCVEAQVLVDGLFGTGFRGELPENARRAEFPCGHSMVIACDIPSGGNGLTGAVSKGVHDADLTVTFGAMKLGMSQYPLREKCGRIRIVPIGTPEDVLRDFAETAGTANLISLEDARSWLPELSADVHKNRRGHLLTVAGSVRMRGACVLAAESAMRMGAGLQTVASAEEALRTLSVRVPECMCLPLRTDENGFFLNEENHVLLEQYLSGKDALLIGCGMGLTENTRNLTKFLLDASDCPVIIDADGLNALEGCIEWIPKGRTILTPHPAEAARLLGVTTAQVQADRPAAAETLAKRTGAVVVLKGAGTIIYDPELDAMDVCTLGNPGMARAGSGDVLAGIIASLTAQGMMKGQAAWCGVTFHAAAGDAAAARLPYSCMLPQDLIRALAEVL